MLGALQQGRKHLQLQASQQALQWQVLLLCAKHCSPEEVQASYMPVAPHSKVCGWGSTAQGEQQPL